MARYGGRIEREGMASSSYQPKANSVKKKKKRKTAQNKKIIRIAFKLPMQKELCMWLD